MPGDDVSKGLPGSELERKISALERAALKVSHDLKSPLFAIGAAATTLRKRLAGGDAQTLRLVEMIEASVEELGRRIDEVLRLGRAGRVAGAPGRVRLERVMERVLERNAATIAARGAEVRVGRLGEVEGDEDLLVEVFENLLSNALRYAEAERLVVEVTAEEEAGGVRVVFRDNGQGFDPGYLARPLEHHPGTSTGLGLTLVRLDVQSLGGRVSVGNEGGARVEVWLPGPGSV